jgi:hypothetical protein
MASPEYRTRHFRAAAHDFVIRTSDRAIADYLDEVLSGLAVPGAPRSIYGVFNSGAEPGRFSVSLDGEHLVSTGDVSEAVDYLLWHVNREVVNRSSSELVLHAAAAEQAGAAIVLTGPSGSGKSTLVAGLLRRGLRYLTDEVVVVDPLTLAAAPYAKPIALKQGSHGVLSDLDPGSGHGRWLVNPCTVRDDAVAPASPVRWVVALRYDAGSEATLTPLRPAAALHALASNCANLAPDAQAKLQALAVVVGASTCCELVTGDLERSCDLVQELVEARPQVAV